MNTFKLGRVLEHDERSRNFPAPMAGELATVRHRFYGPVLDQGNLGSCTGNALSHAFNTEPLRQAKPLLKEPDAVDLYGRATALDSWPGTYPPEDTGSSGLAVCKAAKEKGYISSYTHAFGLDQALHALMLGPVIIGVNFYSGMFETDDKFYMRVSGTLEGGHEMALTGINTFANRVIGRNSWGSAWGYYGRFYMTFTDLGRLLGEGGDVTVPGTRLK